MHVMTGSAGDALLLVLLLVVVILAAWSFVLYRRLRGVERQMDDLFGEATSETLPHMLAEYLTTVRTTAAAVDRVQRDHRRLAEIMPSAVRHVGLVRFSPFHDTGGDQSFTLALLDGQRDGIVITALHSRHDSRLYAKPIERGASQYSLTPEEIEAINIALHAESRAVVS